MRRSFPKFAISIPLLLAACSSSNDTGSSGTNTPSVPSGTAGSGATSTEGQAGAMTTATGGGAGSTDVGVAGAGTTAAGAGGAMAVAGAGGGTANGGAAGAAGAANSNPNQADPGTEGDGQFDQPGPYSMPQEAMGQAPQGGMLIGQNMYSSQVYGYDFPYWIYVPPQYDPAKPAALMVFQDGAHYIGLDEATFSSQQVWNNLMEAGEMPVTIGLFINPGDERSVEYDTVDDTYAQFIDEILGDVILNDYNIVDDPDGWAIAGHSSGGIAAFSVAWYHTDEFHKVMTHNGSFTNIRGGNAYPDTIRAEMPPKPIRVTLLSGTQDINAGNGGDKDWLLANDNMAAALEEMGYHYRYMRGEGMHYPPAQAAADYPDALRWLWRGYTLPDQ